MSVGVSCPCRRLSSLGRTRQTVEPAPTTGPESALEALVDVPWQPMATMLTAVRPLLQLPRSVIALVVPDKGGLLKVNPPQALKLAIGERDSVNDSFSAREKSRLVPLWAVTRLPRRTADVADLCFAKASCWPCCVSICLKTPIC